MNISIFASIGAQNLGDELILKNEIQYFQKKYGKKTHFHVFSYDNKNPFIVSKKIKYYDYFPNKIRKLSKIFINIKNFFVFLKVIFFSDLVVIGGGGIFFDNEKDNTSNPLSQWLMRVRIARFFRKKILFHSVGITIKKPKNLITIKKIFGGKNKTITVRDRYSFYLLKELSIDSEIIADPVFGDKGNTKKALESNYCLQKINPKQFHLDDIESYNFHGKKVGISFRSGYFWKDNKIVKELVEYIIKNKGEVIFLPTSFHNSNKKSNDYLYMKKFAEKYNCKISKSMGQTYNCIKHKKIDLYFAMRLHSMILAQVYKIPYIALSYGKKTDEILKIIHLKGKKVYKK